MKRALASARDSLASVRDRLRAAFPLAFNSGPSEGFVTRDQCDTPFDASQSELEDWRSDMSETRRARSMMPNQE